MLRKEFENESAHNAVDSKEVVVQSNDGDWLDRTQPVGNLPGSQKQHSTSDA